MSWRRTVEPYSKGWSQIMERTKGRGLIHGMQAHAILCETNPHHGSPADTAMFLRDMVAAGVLRPVAKDLAGAGHSVLAFRGLQCLQESKPLPNPDVEHWLGGCPSEAAEAHLWTFTGVLPCST